MADPTVWREVQREAHFLRSLGAHLAVGPTLTRAEAWEMTRQNLRLALDRGEAPARLAHRRACLAVLEARRQPRRVSNVGQNLLAVAFLLEHLALLEGRGRHPPPPVIEAQALGSRDRLLLDAVSAVTALEYAPWLPGVSAPPAAELDRLSAALLPVVAEACAVAGVSADRLALNLSFDVWEESDQAYALRERVDEALRAALHLGGQGAGGAQADLRLSMCLKEVANNLSAAR